MVIFLIAFVLLLVIGVPISISIGASAVLGCLSLGYPLVVIGQKMVSGIDSFLLIAVPLFILAGNLMNAGKITEKIFDTAKELVGWIPGGLGHANVLASVIFAGMSGAAVADAGGLGAIEVKAMRDDGYDDEFSVAVTGASSIIGPIIPPSIPVVVYAVAASVSVGKLLIGGLIPGLVLALCMMVYIYFVSKKRHYPKHAFEGFPALGRSFVKSLPALLTPCIILGGILTGVCTPTEASAVAVAYALILSLVSRNLSLKDLPRIILESAKMTGIITLMIGLSSIMLLLKVGFAVAVPPRHLCCGYPLLAAGMDTAFEDNLAQNRQYLAAMLRNLAKQGFDCKYLVSACGSCRDGLERLHLEEQFPDLLRRDVSQLVLPLLDKNAVQAAPEGKNLIYHGACHCEWADVHKIKGQKQLVKALGDFSGLTVSLNPGCCGESGMGAMTSPQIYNLLRSRKQDRLGQAFADGYDGPVVVGCPSCKIGIARSLIKMHDKRPVLHVAEWLAGLLDGEDRRQSFRKKANESRGEIRVIEF